MHIHLTKVCCIHWKPYEYTLSLWTFSFLWNCILGDKLLTRKINTNSSYFSSYHVRWKQKQVPKDNQKAKVCHNDFSQGLKQLTLSNIHLYRNDLEFSIIQRWLCFSRTSASQCLNRDHMAAPQIPIGAGQQEWDLRVVTFKEKDVCYYYCIHTKRSNFINKHWVYIT